MSNARVVFIDVFINRIQPLEFDVVPSPKNNPQLPVGPNGIIFQNDGHDGFEIHFELQGNTHGYFFPPNNQKRDAVWSQRGNVCPAQTGVWEVFQPIQVVEPINPPPGPVERRTLIVRNKNPGPPPGQGPFMYNLRVTNGVDWKNLDPGGDNTNGHGFSSDVKTATADTLLVAGAVATATYFTMASADLIDSNASLGTALLIALTVGFGIAALLFRLMRRR